MSKSYLLDNSGIDNISEILNSLIASYNILIENKISIFLIKCICCVADCISVVRFVKVCKMKMKKVLGARQESRLWKSLENDFKKQSRYESATCSRLQKKDLKPKKKVFYS